MEGWRGGTRELYGVYLRKWLTFCENRGTQVFQPMIGEVLQFLHTLFLDDKGYSVINTARSALSTFIRIDGNPVGQHPFVTRFCKSVFNQRPCLPKKGVIWDVEVVLTYLRTLSPVKWVSTKLITHKLTMLLLLLSGQRGQTIHLLDTRNMTLTKSKLKFRIGDLVKQTAPNRHVNELAFRAYAPDRRLCIITVIEEYLRRTRPARGSCTNLLLTYGKPVKAASRDSIRRWTREVLKSAGIDTSIFSPHSVRSASTSKAVLRLPLNTILQTAGWTRESTFRKYYKKDITEGKSFQEAILQ